jgi:hypothetical protein
MTERVEGFLKDWRILFSIDFMRRILSRVKEYDEGASEGGKICEVGRPWDQLPMIHDMEDKITLERVPQINSYPVRFSNEPFGSGICSGRGFLFSWLTVKSTTSLQDVFVHP